jgi:hypothetical protein
MLKYSAIFGLGRRYWKNKNLELSGDIREKNKNRRLSFIPWNFLRE